ncbi:hypothetical protein A1D29_02065 [Pasteurellaceae bacterium Orientalotternb1]|nr:hypothetical protein A1D29_02065 [Pasteurellaceae bacterium Orientalotternb1]
MRNPYQLTGYTANGKKTLLGTFDKHGQAVAEMRERKADPRNVYSEFRISKVYQWQIIAYKPSGAIDIVYSYASKAQADRAFEKLKLDFGKLEMQFIGGVNDD